MEVGGPFRVGRGAQGGQERGDGRADILAEHQRSARFKGDHPRDSQRDRDPQGGRRRLDDERQHTAERGAFQHTEVGRGGKRVEPSLEGGQIFDDGKPVLHQFQAEEDHPQPHGRHGDVADPISLGKQIDERTDADDWQPVLADLHRQEPAGDRGADVGPHDDADGLGQCHEPAVDESHHHDRRDRAGLNQHGDDRSDRDGQQSVVGHGANQPSQAGAGHRLQSLGHVLHAQQEDTQSAYDDHDQLQIVGLPHLDVDFVVEDFARLLVGDPQLDLVLADLPPTQHEVVSFQRSFGHLGVLIVQDFIGQFAAVLGNVRLVKQSVQADGYRG